MKKNKLNKFVIIGIFYFIILLTISTAYSFFNEDLSITTTASIDNTSLNENFEYSYTLQAKWQQDNAYVYHFLPTLTYLGTEPTTSWKLYIKVPMDTEIIGCWNAESCIVEGEILTISSTTHNEVLSPESNSITPSFQMKTNTGDYEFEIAGASFTTADGSSTTDTPTNPDNDPDTEENDDNNTETPDDSDDTNNTEDPNDTPTDSTTIDYITPTLKMTGGWGTISTYILEVVNNSENVTISSWTATVTFPSGTTIKSIWGGSYNYDEVTGIVTLHGPDWSPSLDPTSQIEVNMQIDTNLPCPYTPIIGKWIGTTSTGEKVETNILIGSDS